MAQQGAVARRNRPDLLHFATSDLPSAATDIQLVVVELLLLIAALPLLLALNAFFVLAEFAIVQLRPSRVTELIAAGNKRGHQLAAIQSDLDAYLSVCQIGITLASVALGFVGDHATTALVGGRSSSLRFALVSALSYLVVSGSHILLGELVPKSMAIRVAERASLAVAAPLRAFRLAFYPALWLLNHAAVGILRLLGFSADAKAPEHTENELRILLDQSQERGMMSFRRLLFMENVFDFGGLAVRDAMRPRSRVHCLDVHAPWADNLATIRDTRFTRYPILSPGADRPTGFIHLKDLVIGGQDASAALGTFARPLLTTTETAPLESLLTEMQRSRVHVAMVVDAVGKWSGLITLEDVIEELVGTIRDEFEDEEPLRLSDVLTAEFIHLKVHAASLGEAVAAALARTPDHLLPLERSYLLSALTERERLVGVYLGDGIALPHARLVGLTRPIVMLLRSETGVPCNETSERAHLMFVLLTPAGQPRVHQRLLSMIAGLLHNSDYVRERFLTAATVEELVEVIRTGEQAALG
jgi:CBS domain containing-hemolysin-like protein/mannitol/fructose-specific phosphotransferase system IIA component (Ntr-type)